MSSYEPSQFDAQSSVPTPVDIAELALVEAELDKRWPETKIEPSLTRIEALMDVLARLSTTIRRCTSREPTVRRR